MASPQQVAWALRCRLHVYVYIKVLPLVVGMVFAPKEKKPALVKRLVFRVEHAMTGELVCRPSLRPTAMFFKLRKQIATKSGFIRFNLLIDREIAKFRKKTAEQIYAELADRPIGVLPVKATWIDLSHKAFTVNTRVANDVVVSPAGDYIALIAGNWTTDVWHLTRGRVLTVEGSTTRKEIVFLDDTLWMLGIGYLSESRQYDLLTSKQVLPLDSPFINSRDLLRMHAGTRTGAFASNKHVSLKKLEAAGWRVVCTLDKRVSRPEFTSTGDHVMAFLNSGIGVFCAVTGTLLTKFNAMPFSTASNIFFTRFAAAYRPSGGEIWRFTTRSAQSNKKYTIVPQQNMTSLFPVVVDGEKLAAVDKDGRCHPAFLLRADENKSPVTIDAHNVVEIVGIPSQAQGRREVVFCTTKHVVGGSKVFPAVFALAKLRALVRSQSAAMGNKV